MTVVDELIPERLSLVHNVTGFDCGVASLNYYLKNEALNQQRQRISFTTVYLHQGTVAGYVTLANDTIGLEFDTMVDDLDTRYSQLPALKICRIARDIRYRGQGIGTHIIEDVVAYAHSLNSPDNILGTGCRFVTADVRDMTLLYNFYIPNEFEIHKQDGDLVCVRFNLGALPEEILNKNDQIENDVAVNK